MTLAEAKQEFAVRYYLWARSDFEKEIDSSFPGFSSFKTGAVWEFYQFAQRLNRREQTVLAHGSLKQVHADAAKALGETSSEKERALHSKLYAFWRLQNLYQLVRTLAEDEYVKPEILRMWNPEGAQLLGQRWIEEVGELRHKLEAMFGMLPPSREGEVSARRSIGEKVKLAPKRKFRTTILTKFKQAFGSQCLELACVGLDPDLEFKMNCRGWLLSTNFDFTGRGPSQLSYWHSLTGPMPINSGRRLAALSSSPIGFAEWLGIGQTHWEYIMDVEVERTCDAAVELCRRFIQVAPTLLQGLDYESITDKEQNATIPA
jgi:hypothetical protein